jgi:very-short-patch-repair endonuclease
MNHPYPSFTRRGKKEGMSEQINNKKALLEFRKSLRNNSTSAEVTLWTYLQKRQLEGRKFRRQHSVGNYILDFYCPSERLCVELDGAGHFTEEGMKNDEERTRYLNSFDIRVIRFENQDVFNHINNVLEAIKSNFKS